ncbi:preprotein translocase subunit SecG [Geobacter sp. FeAm09]|uniref:preprotein translocase subunit SecG n=1 Tax=Geobacter sp. FeAm09 TaxID=2597769 RepID=UPI0011F049B7|nr:preprotein translocase subunit SecG [Geobacter sp. FeAm09]QEM68626.1 preprotein translocase subunit SecG [Geobacter sp. FeAm09]
MIIALTILHVLVSIFMIAVVLLQSGKGAEMGASFGSGGSQSVFGAGGGTTFLSKMTTGAAIIFMLTSLTLAYISGQPSSSSIMSGKGKSATTTKAPVQMPQPAAPAQQGKPADLPGAPATSPQQQK